VISVSVDVEVSYIEDLDFVPTYRCEHARHNSDHKPDGMAKYLIKIDVECGCFIPKYLICEVGLNRFLQIETVHCIKCNKDGWRFNVTILETL
jgi:hypothetical protein